MDAQKFTIGDSFSFGWAKMKHYFRFFFTVLVISTVLAILGQVVDRFQGDTASNTWLAIELISVGVSIFIGAILKIGLIKSELAVSLEKDPSARFFKPDILLMVKLGLLYIVMMVILAISFLLLVIPGLYIAIRLQYAYMAAVDHGYWPFRAISASWKITRGSWWDLLLFKITCIAANILGGLALLVGLFASIPTTRIASAHVYRRLSR